MWRGAEKLGEVERYGDAEWYREVQGWERVFPHPHVMDKQWEGYLRSEGSKPQPRPPNPGFQCQKNKSS